LFESARRTLEALTTLNNRPALDRGALRRDGRLAGILFIGGAISAVPASFLVEPEPEGSIYLLTVLGVASGLLCLILPWERISPRWLHAIPVIATIEIAAVVGLGGPVFSYLYFFVGIYVAAIFSEPRELVAHFCVIGIALFAPLVYEPDDARETLTYASAFAPGIVITGFVISRLTSRLRQSGEAYRRLSGQDALTGVGNYRALHERLWQETARHARRDREFALLILDLDGFKAVNETQGHLVGDLVLTAVGSMLGLKVRAEDTVFRHGGDEFSVLAPETDREQARTLSARLEDALSGIRAGPVTVTATVATAVFPHEGTDPGQLMASADAALLARKQRRPRFAPRGASSPQL
jgi:diguanylate cyclase (GGDEF)-like protein